MPAPDRGPVRIANASGFFGDRMSALADVVRGGPIDVVTGDYLAEVTMGILVKQRFKNPELGYVATFLTQLEPVLGTILERRIKVVVNAGGLNPHGLTAALKARAEKAGLAPKIATLDGDDVRLRVEELRAGNDGFPSLESGTPLSTDPGWLYTANAYLGAWGIVRALAEGADIVVCPRVTDASLVVGAAAWWHGWARDDWDRLAGAVAAGHVIECGAQATGGNYSSFEEIGDLSRPGFPIAEIAADGSSVITKHEGTAGAVSVGTVTAQLVYEVGGPRYLNPDVVTRLDTIALAEIAADRVSLRGARGEPPPPTTKVAMIGRGSYRNEMLFGFVGLDIDSKIALFERVTRAANPKAALTFQRIGTANADAASENEATVLLRVVAVHEDEAVVSRAFSSSLIEQGLSSYPGLFATDIPGPARITASYFPTLVRQADLKPTVTHHDGRVEEIPLPPTMTAPPGYDAPPAGTFAGATVRGPLGRLVDARSGDKGANANVGLWTRTDEAYGWLRAELTVERLRELVPEAATLRIERFELANLRALNFVIHDLLAGGAVATLRFDRQAKALGEFLRGRHVDLPKGLL